ncbi:MAG: FAD-dependent oxidoreductase [Acidimicrobiia bacterium]
MSPTGRRARTAWLGLETVGVDTDQTGHIVVDDRMTTTNPGVYAARDVTNLAQFVYVAALSGAIAAEHALRGTGRRIDHHAPDHLHQPPDRFSGAHRSPSSRDRTPGDHLATAT